MRPGIEMWKKIACLSIFPVQHLWLSRKQQVRFVPQIYAVSEDRKVYLQEDLGTQTLLDVVGQERKGNSLSEHSMQLYRKSLSELLRFQLIGGQGLDYARCVPRPVFDRQCILWDLNYFKYCFLKLAGADFSAATTKLGLIACTDLREDNPFSFDLNFFHDYSILHYTAFQITLNQLHHSFILFIPAK